MEQGAAEEGTAKEGAAKEGIAEERSWGNPERKSKGPSDVHNLFAVFIYKTQQKRMLPVPF